jgi:hypothetical protein
MKKNDHYFPTMDWIKDPSEPSGWKRVTYEQGGKAVLGEGTEGVLVGDGGDEDVGDMDIDGGIGGGGGGEDGVLEATTSHDGEVPAEADLGSETAPDIVAS